VAEPGKGSDVFSALVVITLMIFLIGIGIAALEWTAYSEDTLPPVPSRSAREATSGPPQVVEGGATEIDVDDEATPPDAGGGDQPLEF
jgi:hypothetical protein